jgi:hypothetical protein
VGSLSVSGGVLFGGKAKGVPGRGGCALWDAGEGGVGDV